MRGGTMGKETAAGGVPQSAERKSTGLLPKLVEFCRAEEIPVVFPREIAESFGVPGYDQEDPGSLAQLSMALTLGATGPSSGRPGM